MQDLWFKGPIWWKGKVPISPRKVEPYFRHLPNKVPEAVSKRIVSTRTYLKVKTRFKNL